MGPSSSPGDRRTAGGGLRPRHGRGGGSEGTLPGGHRQRREGHGQADHGLAGRDAAPPGGHRARQVTKSESKEDFSHEIHSRIPAAVRHPGGGEGGHVPQGRRDAAEKPAAQRHAGRPLPRHDPAQRLCDPHRAGLHLRHRPAHHHHGQRRGLLHGRQQRHGLHHRHRRYAGVHPAGQGVRRQLLHGEPRLPLRLRRLLRHAGR